MSVGLIVFFISILEFAVKINLASVHIVKEGVYPLEQNSVAIQFYAVVENSNSLHASRIHYYPKKCCLNDEGHEDCGLMVYGGETYIKPNEIKTIKFVYPTLYQYNQIGHCHFILNVDYNGIKKRSIEWIQDFDTRFKRSNKLVKNLGKTKHCATLDLNPLENCEPINCDQKYNGERPYFDTKTNKCVKIPICNMDPTKELPDIVYNPGSNTCKNLDDSFTVADALAISSNYGVVTEPTATEELKVQVESNCSTISQNLQLLRDLMYGKFYSADSTADYGSLCKSAIVAILTCICSLCFFLLFLVFCLNAITWLIKKISNGDMKKYYEELKSKFQKPECMTKESRVNNEVKNKLLKDIIVTDLPIELRESAVNICERIEKEVKRKRRYRMVDVGSQISLLADPETSDSSYDD